MSEDLIDRLRRENPLPEDLAMLPIEAVLHRLDDVPSATRSGADARPSWIRWRYHASESGLAADAAQAPMRGASRATNGVRSRAGAAIALASSAAIAIAVTAVVVVGHGHRPSTSMASTTSSRGLSAEFAVLRRPQTRTDRVRLAVGVQRQLNLVASLTRLAATAKASPTTKVKLYVIVTAPRPVSSRPPDERDLQGLKGGSQYQAAVLALFLNARGAEFETETAGPQPAALLRRPGAINSANGFRTSLVPDGVTSVAWVFQSADRKSRSSIAITAQVKNNVAFAHVGSAGPLLRATWYGANGATIAVYDPSS